MKFEELEQKVIEWGKEKGILEKSDVKSQMLKCVAEVGELADAINEDDDIKIIDGLGDVLVTLILTHRMFVKDYYFDATPVSVSECLNIAYHEIADRKGEMVNGVFVKE